MNRELLESQWVQVRELLKEKFSNLSEEDLRQINGRYDQLVVKLQEKYGYSREEAEEKIRILNFDRFSSPKSYVVRDEVVETKPDNSSFYKWLLGLGIPLLLLGAYLLNKPVEVPRQPPVTQEQVIQETPADRSISSGLRSALLAQQNPAFDMKNIQITTHDGVVTLSGSVPNVETRNFAVTTARNFAGVKQVVNHIEVK